MSPRSKKKPAAAPAPKQKAPTLTERVKALEAKLAAAPAVQGQAGEEDALAAARVAAQIVTCPNCGASHDRFRAGGCPTVGCPKHSE